MDRETQPQALLVMRVGFSELMANRMAAKKALRLKQPMKAIRLPMRPQTPLNAAEQRFVTASRIF